MWRQCTLAGLACLIGLLLAFFWPVLFQREQFGYRDAAHYYYPLYQRVEQEWKAGRIPLWETEENAGMPLLGNPTAAVLYPVKLCYTLAPSYDWGVRIYTLAHLVLAVAGALALARHWGQSAVAAWLAGLAYGFGGAILFQYCNIIFLVGAAWAPWGFLAADRWLVGGHARAIGELAIVLAMETLGGDPQIAYLTGLCTAVYAWMLSRRSAGDLVDAPRRGAWRRVVLVLLILAAWVGLTLAAAVWLQRPGSPQKKPLDPFPWVVWITWATRGAWLAVGLVLLARWRKSSSVGALDRRLAGLIAAGVLGVMLSAAQLLPVLEFTSRSVRSSGEGPHDYYPFSLEPIRLIEFFWPGVFGSSFQGNSAWLWLLPPRHSPDIWVPSMYLGVLAMVLAVATLVARGGPSWQRWLVVVAVVGFLASIGRFGSPIFWARGVPGWSQWLGMHDTRDVAAIRFDGHLRDGDGGVYWLLATIFPGFGSFRYPSKLMTLTCLALSALAGAGWDRLLTDDAGRRRARVVCLGTLAVTLVVLVGVFVGRLRIEAAIADAIDPRVASIFGRLTPDKAWLAMARALIHCGAILAAGALLFWYAPRAPMQAGVALLALHAADLALANRVLVMTVPEAMFAEPPEVVRLIREAEQAQPTPGGLYRVHRIPMWEPIGWYQRNEPLRHQDLVRWERRTIQPKYAIPYGVPYTLTEGVSELYDYMFFFAPFPGVYEEEELTKKFLGANSNDRLVAFPRRGFDLWNTKYFLVPYVAGNDEHRGIASFLPHTKLLEPAAPAGETEAERKRRLEAWSGEEDWQLLRNESAYPRAWVVHEVKFWPPILGMGRAAREPLMYELLYQNDPLWSMRGREIYDPRALAWVETEDSGALQGYLSRAAVLPSESPRIVQYAPDRVEIEVDLSSPGLVVLSDVYYPGWKLTIDGQPAPIHRTNRMMRGAAVLSGKHTLVYRYEPDSFRHGGMMSAGGLAIVGALWLWSMLSGRGRRKLEPTQSDDGVEPGDGLC